MVVRDKTLHSWRGHVSSTEPPLPFSVLSPEEVGERIWSCLQCSPRTEPAQLLPQHNSPVQQEDLGGPPSKDELQGSLDVPSCGLQGPQAQLVVVDPHVSQLLQLGLPLALEAGLP